MIDKKSFELFNKLVKDDNYKYIFDITIIYQVNETLQYLQLIIDEEYSNSNFIKVCNEVKRQYLKYNDIALNDSLVETVLNEMGFINE